MVSFMGVVYFFLFLIPIFYVLRFLSKTSIIYMIIKSWQSLIDKLHVYQFYKVPRFNQNNSLHENKLYRKINLYLNSLPNLDDSSDFTTLLSGPKSHDIFFQHDSLIHDTFLSAKLTWTHHQTDDDVNGSSYVLKIKKSEKKRVFRQYFQHILTIADELEQRNNNKDIKLYINLMSLSLDVSIQRWRSVPLTHPATWDSIVMETELKNKIRLDLEQFLKSKQYYNRLGRVWKRSYLLYGPSGTGKTSFAAAMARFLSYDVYDLDVSNKLDSDDVKLLVLRTPPKSLILVENIDRYSPEFKSTIVSSCGDERVIVFTMSTKADHVAADVHVHFPLCDFPAFKTLANTYLGLKEHKLFPAVEEVFSSGGSLSAAEIGEIMISNRGSVSRALKAVIAALQNDVEEKTTVKVAQALTSSGSGRSTSEEEGGGGGVFCRESVHTVREFRKLYGLLRLGSRRKEEPPVVVPLDRSSSEKEGSRHERMLV